MQQSPRPASAVRNYNLSLDDRKRLINATMKRVLGNVEDSYVAPRSIMINNNADGSNEEPSDHQSTNNKSRPSTASSCCFPQLTNHRKRLYGNIISETNDVVSCSSASLGKNSKIPQSLRRIDFGLPEDDTSVNYVFTSKKLVSRIKDDEVDMFNRKGEYSWRSPLKQQQQRQLQGGNNSAIDSKSRSIIKHGDGTMSIIRAEVSTEIRSSRPISRAKNLTELVDDFETAAAVFSDEKEEETEFEKESKFKPYTLIRRSDGKEERMIEGDGKSTTTTTVIKDNLDTKNLHAGDKKEIAKIVKEQKQEAINDAREEDLEPLDLSDEDEDSGVGEW